MGKWRGDDGRFCTPASARSVTSGKCKRRRDRGGRYLRNQMKALVENISGKGIDGLHILHFDDDLSVDQLHDALRRLLPGLKGEKSLWVRVWNSDFEFPCWVTVNVLDDVPRKQAKLQVDLARW
jgi:hypothetical protein